MVMVMVMMMIMMIDDVDMMVMVMVVVVLMLMVVMMVMMVVMMVLVMMIYDDDDDDDSYGVDESGDDTLVVVMDGVIRLSLGRRLVDLLPVAQRTNAFTTVLFSSRKTHQPVSQRAVVVCQSVFTLGRPRDKATKQTTSLILNLSTANEHIKSMNAQQCDQDHAASVSCTRLLASYFSFGHLMYHG